LLDSLRAALEIRAIELKEKPEGLGRQFEDIPPMIRAPNITRGDSIDAEGHITYSKTAR
jgi:hypothetical protein